jgi:hypothetical protein
METTKTKTTRTRKAASADIGAPKASKVAAKATTDGSPKCTAKKTVANFPKERLNTWLNGRQHWNHNDWLGLLGELRNMGYAQYADTTEGQDSVGLYLEQNRTR